ncbi:hypothetical protein HC031_24240 [Planosporangium thailandense]|uniref:Uncharacterized protein n=1 Tax=Planosporangium thailandense TaxID=765197 RepID=A0ABX0Y406_9ACTN|nr:hypothetical protein [Planosporangium thailandense]
MPSAHTPQPGNRAGAWQKFSTWRRERPFSGGLLLILSGIELFLSSNLDLGAMQVHVGPTGFLSYVIPAMLLLCGGGALVTPHLRLFYGVVGSLVAVYSLIGLNLGGFLFGLLLGIVGGALTIAWSPVVTATPTVDGDVDAEGTDYAAGPQAAGPQAAGPQAAGPQAAGLGEAAPRPGYGHPQPYAGAPAMDETAEIPRHVQDPERWWGSEPAGQPAQQEEPPFGTNSGGSHTRMLAITLVPVTIAATLVAVVHRTTPAYAAPCPVPSASTSAATASGQATARPGAAAGNKPGTSGNKPGASGNNSAAPGNQPAVPAGAPAAAPQGGQNAAPQSGAGDAVAPGPTASAAPAAKSGNPLTDLWDGLVGGVKKLFGAGTSATPAAPATPDPSVAPSASAVPGPSAAPSGGGKSPDASAPAPRSASAAPNRPQASATPSTSASTAPCPQLTIAAVEPGQPPAALQPGLITGATQVMHDFKYEGIVDLPTSGGTKKVLKFTMTSAVTTPFTLKVSEKAGKTTQITSSELTIQREQNVVTFYTSKFTGTLTHVTLPVIPIPIGVPDILQPLTTLTFTPDSPPPLPPIAFPEITFENVTLELAFVHSDILTAKAMQIQEL